ncbi:MAG: ATP-binding domain-containing protein, partial [Clostridium sp.]
SEVLPGLGEDNIKTTTLEKYSKGFLPGNYSYESKNSYLEYLYEGKENEDYNIRNKGMVFKNSLEFVDILDKFIEELPKLLINTSSIYFDGEELIKKNKVYDTFIVRFKSLPLLKRIDALKESLFSQVENKYLEQSKSKNPKDFGYDPMDFDGPIEEYFKHEINEQVNKMFPALNAVSVYKLLWEEIQKYSSKELYEIKEFTLKNIGMATVLYEDIIPLIYIRSMMEGFRNYSEIKHIIIDECQDYSPLFYLLIKKTFRNATATILGDLNQRISGANSLSKKEEISNIFGDENTTLKTLRKSYRSTLNITNFSKEILIDGEEIEGVEREGLPPKVYIENQDLVNLIYEMKERGMNSIAIITKTSKASYDLYNELSKNLSEIKLIIDDSSSYGKGISIIPSYIAKGLEFDGVIVPDGDDETYNLDSERNLLYTVCSRALHELHICTNGNKSRLLP